MIIYDNLPPLKFLSIGVVERPSTSPQVSPRIVYLRCFFFISHFPLDLFQSTNTAIESGLASSEDNLTIYHEMMIICLQGLKVPPAGRWEESW